MSLAEVEAATESAQVGEEGGSLGRDAWRRLRRDPVALVGFGLVAFFVLVAIFAPLIAPYGPTDNPGAGVVTPTTIPGPSAEHWFGLDELGRDEFSRVIYGARQSLLVGVVSLTLGMIGGLTLGVLAGAFGGKVDTIVMRIVDIMLSIPGLLFAIGIAAMLGPSLLSVMIAIAVVNVPIFARLLRGQMLVAAGKRLRPGRDVARRAPAGDRARPRAAELDVAGHRPGDPDLGHGDHRRGRSVVPRSGQRRSRGPRVGPDARRHPALPRQRPASRVLPRRRDRDRRAGLHPAR